MSFINLYYGAKAPVVAGARQFNTVQEALAKGEGHDNYYATIEFTPKAPKAIKFDYDSYLDLVEIDDTHKLQTRDGRSARIIADDRVSKKEYCFVALVMNAAGTKETVMTCTPDGTFQIGEQNDMDLFIVKKS